MFWIDYLGSTWEKLELTVNPCNAVHQVDLTLSSDALTCNCITASLLLYWVASNSAGVEITSQMKGTIKTFFFAFALVPNGIKIIWDKCRCKIFTFTFFANTFEEIFKSGSLAIHLKISSAVAVGAFSANKTIH